MNIRLIIFLFLFAVNVNCQTTQKTIYKTIGSVNLEIEIFQATNKIPNQKSPAIIFFFGGGWNGGTTDQFRPQAEYLASRGMVAILADYRVKTKHQASPFESLMDAKSAIRLVRMNASKWNIDPNRIVASGGSAGGHLAAATALIEAYNDPQDDTTISCVPNALILFNPVIDNGPGGYAYERIGAEYKNFSPLHNILPGAPPTLFMLGTKDALIPVETGAYYQKVMEIVGSRCELKLYEDAGHGFFNPRNPEFYKATLNETDLFLQSLGYIEQK